jgi:galactonate dehydratase
MRSSREELSMFRNTQLRRARLTVAMQSAPSTPSKAENELTITDFKAWSLREPVSKRIYSVVKIQTRSGLAGFGECAPLAVTEIERAKKTIIGHPATAFEVTAPLLADSPTARAALNIAMLDVVGKATKAPIFQVLGGPTRHKARALVATSGDSNASLIGSMQRGQAAGFRAFLVPAPLAINSNQGHGYVLATKKRLETLRAAAGADADFVLDGGSLLTPGDAQMVSAAIEQFHVLWFNEPCPLTNLGALRKLAGEGVTPIGIGRGVRDCSVIQDLLREDAVDIIRPDIGLNGISQIRRMAAIAETYYVAVGPTHDGGPIGTAAALHLAAALPNFFIQQIPLPEGEEDRRMRLELTAVPVEIVKDGFAELPIGPGLGITVNERALEKYAEATT